VTITLVPAIPGRCSLAAQEISLAVTRNGAQPPLSLQIVFGCNGSVTSAMTLVVRAAFIVTIASRALGWPVHVAFMTAHEGTGIGVGGGNGDGVTLGSGLGEGLGDGLATSEGVGLVLTAVPAFPQAATTRTTTTAPTPHLIRD
jgi:hypothetical protein